MYKIVVTASGDKLYTKLLLQQVDINDVQRCCYSKWRKMMYKVVVTVGGVKCCTKLLLQQVDINDVQSCCYSM